MFLKISECVIDFLKKTLRRTCLVGYNPLQLQPTICQRLPVTNPGN